MLWPVALLALAVLAAGPALGLAHVGRRLQSGYVRGYALTITIGTVALLAYFVLRWRGRSGRASTTRSSLR